MENMSSNSKDILEAFCKVADVPLTFFDCEGIITWECNSEMRICNLFDVYRQKNSVCTTRLGSAADIAARLGEPHIFSCRAGFMNIAVSLIIRGEVTGYFIAGPFALGKTNEETITNIFNINDLNQRPETISALTNFLSRMKIYASKDISLLATVLNSSIMSAITPNNDYIKINELYKKMATPERRLHGEQGKHGEYAEHKDNADLKLELSKKEKILSPYGNRSNLINQAVQIIKSSYMQKVSLEKVAGKLYISQSYLSMHFKHEMGATFTDYLNDIRIKASMELLTETNMSLMEVALSTGFEDQSYFTKVFKKSQNCTPKEYRQVKSKRLT